MKLALGTVQFGLDYGISNQAGRTPQTEVAAILSLAHRNGVRLLDTAALYGESERVLGACMTPEQTFRVISKAPPLTADGTADPVARLRTAFKASLAALRKDRLEGYMLHRSADLMSPHGPAIMAAMEALRDAGQVRRLGVSVYAEEELQALFPRFPLDLVQLPLNLLDQRLVRSGQLRRLKDMGVEIHVRSAFLQGLLLMAPDQLPGKLAPLRAPLGAVAAAAHHAGVSVRALALAFLRHLPEVDRIVLGVVNREQLRDNLADYESAARVAMDYTPLACDDTHLLNPSNW